ncbi:hypothetical protein P4O66_010646 [Electrophorus voltai]|uniref:Ephrin RBD domain-containing protein n=1 Tax=Electrophorus voltai TaxID=2609070 RepID=A0AAD8ZBX7_9TELE|nr:hypothetical protein P4O66_010646 [Electrophorus voltai]
MRCLQLPGAPVILRLLLLLVHLFVRPGRCDPIAVPVVLRPNMARRGAVISYAMSVISYAMSVISVTGAGEWRRTEGPREAVLTSDDYTVQVKLNDYLDILCPHYPPDSPLSGPPETLALYLVAEAQFRGCQETEGAIKRWECKDPQALYGPIRFTEKIQRFTPFSLGTEFLPGHHYYYSLNWKAFGAALARAHVQ